MGFEDRKERGLEGSEIAVVPPLAFLEVKGEVFFDSVELGQAAFGKAPEGLDAVDVGAAVSESLGLVDADVFVVTDVDQAIITAPGVGEEDAGGIHFAPQNRLESGFRAIGDDLRVDASSALVDPKNRLFEGRSAALARPLASAESSWPKIGFVRFDDADHLPQLGNLMIKNHASKQQIKAIDRVAIDPQKHRRFRGLDVQTKAFHDFQKSKSAQLAPLEYLGHASC